MVFISYTHTHSAHIDFIIFMHHTVNLCESLSFVTGIALYSAFFPNKFNFFYRYACKEEIYIRKKMLYMRVFLAIIIIRIFFVDFRKNYKSVYICRYILKIRCINWWKWSAPPCCWRNWFFLVMNRFNEIIYAI